MQWRKEEGEREGGMMDAGLKSVRAQAIYGLMCWAGGAKVPREGLEGWGSRRGVKAGFNSGFARANHVARLPER